MSWIQNSVTKQRAAMAIALAASSFTATALAATIVVRSDGPSATAYPPGKSLPSGAAIVLKAGDVITVLDTSGTRVLRGPGKVSVSGAGQVNSNGISALLADTGARQSRTGATRGSSAAAPHPTNLWYVDVARGGNFCVGDVKALALWRAGSDQAASLTVAPSGGARVAIEFRPGQAVVPWPLAALPLADGRQYRIQDGASGSTGGAPVTITVRLLPSSPNTLDSAATALLEHGCAAQVDTLVAATNASQGS